MMTVENAVTIANVLSAVVALASAGAWWRSASLSYPLPMAYLSGPPQHVVDTVKATARWNTLAAALTGATAACQSVAVGLPLVVKALST